VDHVDIGGSGLERLGDRRRESGSHACR
jgi:hypothetical protein